MDKVWIVQGTHWYVSGIRMSAHGSLASAQIKALELVNDLRKDCKLQSEAGLKPETDPTRHETALQEARRARAKDLGIGVDDLDDDNDDADVWITELEINP